MESQKTTTADVFVITDSQNLEKNWSTFMEGLLRKVILRSIKIDRLQRSFLIGCSLGGEMVYIQGMVRFEFISWAGLKEKSKDHWIVESVKDHKKRWRILEFWFFLDALWLFLVWRRVSYCFEPHTVCNGLVDHILVMHIFHFTRKII